MGSHFTIEALCAIFNVTARTIYNELSEKREKLDRPMYRRGQDRRLRRYVTPHDFEVLRTVFRMRVKKN